MFDVGEEMEIGRGTTASRPETTALRPEIKEICNADD